MTKRPRLSVALIEIGTNSIKLLIAGFTTAPEYEIQHLSRITTRLGAGLERNNRIDPMNLAKTLDCSNISVPPGGPLMDMSRDQAFALF